MTDENLPAGVSADGPTRPKLTPTRAQAPRPSRATPTRAPAKESTPEDVERAVATMNAIYGAIGAGLIFGARLPETAEALGDKLDELEQANRQAFNASPQLARLIAGAAPIASVSTFFVAHVTIAGGLIMLARQEIAAKRNETDDDGTSAPVME